MTYLSSLYVTRQMQSNLLRHKAQIEEAQIGLYNRQDQVQKMAMADDFTKEIDPEAHQRMFEARLKALTEQNIALEQRMAALKTKSESEEMLKETGEQEVNNGMKAIYG